jgi:hypothetical protein
VSPTDEPQRERRDGPTPVSLESLAALGGAIPPELRLKVRLTRLWPEIVGATVARASRPGSLVDGKLTVLVNSGAWAVTIQGTQRRLLENLRRHCPDLVIKQVRTLVRPWDDEPEATPPPRPAEGPTGADLDAVTLSAAACAAVDEAAGRLSDPELRQRFKAAMTRAQQRRQWRLAAGWTVGPGGDLQPPRERP